MNRLFFVVSSLESVESVENDLIGGGINESHIHLLSSQPNEADKRNLHEVSSLAKSDVYQSTLKGIPIGVLLASAVVALTHYYSWYTQFTWVPFIFLAILVMGFSCWEFGLWGIQHRNSELSQFDNTIDKGRHVLLIDSDSNDREKIKSICLNVGDVFYAGARNIHTPI
tara:strand:- start:1211 stop:1717 length:507 start_codon:yes stop_codon:yes gene_type:complete